MNEQLQNALAEILGKTLNGIDAASSFVVAELPDVIQQLLMWYAIKGFLLFAVGITLIPMYYKFCRWAYVKSENNPDSIPVFLVFSCIPFGATLFLFNLDWLQIIIAPKIWLIEYASELVK